MHLRLGTVILPLSLATAVQGATTYTTYQACPLIRAYYPAPTLNKNSDTIKSLAQEFTDKFDALIAKGGSDDYGTITPNTTSFSVILFSGAASAESDPIFFEYHYTAPLSGSAENVTSNTQFPLGTLTQLFTVYTWLVEVGDASWGLPITDLLPELRQLTQSSSNDTSIPVSWDDVTIGSLAAHMSGILRDSNACDVLEPCDRDVFLSAVAASSPYFEPDTTPLISNAAFQLLAFALEAHTGRSFATTLADSVLAPLNMTQSGLLSRNGTANLFAAGGGIGDSSSSAATAGEQAALSLYASARDLARAGHAMLSARLVPAAATRRWLAAGGADTSNLRNGAGRPWEVYRASGQANESITDVVAKSGDGAVTTAVGGGYASYFGLAPNFGAGFAVLGHDAAVAASGAQLDLNVYEDVVSLAIASLQALAAAEAQARYAGQFTGANTATTTTTDVNTTSYAHLNVTDSGPGLEMLSLVIDGVDLRAQASAESGIALASLDFRLYPSNVGSADGRVKQFVAVFQDRDAPVDMDTPTCITWMDVGSLESVPTRYLFELDDDGVASRLLLPGIEVSLKKA